MTPTPKSTREALAAALPEIDYAEAIKQAYAHPSLRAPQGTLGCIAFKTGAEWYRSIALAALTEQPAAQPDSMRALVMDYAVACGELSKGLPADDPMWSELRALGDRLDTLATQPAAPDLMTVVEHVLDAGHLNTEDLGRLRAAWERAVPAAPQGVQAEPPSGDTPLLDFLREESLDLRCINVPTGGDDYDIRWLVIGHYQEKPRERLIGESFTDEPRDAIKDAMANTDTRGSYDHPARPGAPSPAPAVQPTEAVARPSYDDLVWCLERIKEASTSYDTAFELSSKILDQVAVRRRYEAQQQAAAHPEAVAELVKALQRVGVQTEPPSMRSAWQAAMAYADAWDSLSEVLPGGDPMWSDLRALSKRLQALVPAAPAQEPQQPELEALRIQVRQADERGDEALRLAHAWERAAVESGGWLPDATGYPRWSASKAKAAAQAQDGAVAELVDVLKTVVAVSGLASIAIAKHGTDGGQSNG